MVDQVFDEIVVVYYVELELEWLVDFCGDVFQGIDVYG